MTYFLMSVKPQELRHEAGNQARALTLLPLDGAGWF